ncbi:hypothetical protein Tco_0909064 [Tanacetum coccineum]|uniref:Uncharacterized protein n=1 Tax=Tanacetum coccineum TaxID=301880 RepID=A0ABQ5CPZ3_9ASTR
MHLRCAKLMIPRLNVMGACKMLNKLDLTGANMALHRITRHGIRPLIIPAECKASEGNEDPLSTKHQRLIKGLADGKASASNLRDIQVKDIVKEVKDYLKTYSPAEMDIRWYVEGML